MEEKAKSSKKNIIDDPYLGKVSKRIPIKIPTRFPIKKQLKKDEDIDNGSFLATSFPVVILVILIVLFGIFYYLFNTYKREIVINTNGFMLNNGNQSLLLGSKKKDENNLIINTLNVKENDVIYQTPVNYYLENDRKKPLNMNYPLFTNDGLTIVNYNLNVNLVDNKFNRTFGYEGLVLSYGRAYDFYEYTQIDKENYLLLSYKDGISINLYDLNVKTTLNEYNIPVNSFIFFEKDSISYYERKKDTFVYRTINDIDYKSILTFSYESANEEYVYDYETFLEGIGTIFVVVEDIPDVDEEIKPGENEEVEKDPNDNVDSENKPGDDEFVYIKPEVSIEQFVPNVYSMSNKLVINDPAKVIEKAPTFTLYSNGKVYMNRTFYTSGNILISGLLPNTTFTIVGKYTYLDEDMKTKKIVTFYTKTLKTKELSDLEPIELSFENGLIYPKKIEINNVKVVSDLSSEAIRGVNKIALSIKDIDYYLTPVQIGSIISGIDTQVSTSESLKSSETVDYKFTFYDRANNIIASLNDSGSTRTSKRPPSVSLKLKTNLVDEVVISINNRNDDNILLNDYKYTLMNSSGRILKQDYITGNILEISGLDPNQIFIIKVTADIDIDDNQGVHDDYLLSEMEFTTKPITSLGYVNMSVKQDGSSSDSALLEYFVNARKTDAILLKLLKKLTFEIYKKDSDELVDSISVSDKDIEDFKNKEVLNVLFENLDSDTVYDLKITSLIVQGETEYTFDCVYDLSNVTTFKTPAKVEITNSFTTETMVDFDVIVVDIDKTILTDYIRLELKDNDNNILDVKTIKISNDVQRITYNNLEVNKFYTINFYADEYNESHSNETYKYKHLISSWTVYTDQGISGKVELVSSLRNATGTNLVDKFSNVKWMQTEQYYNIPKTIDEEGDIHIYSKTGASAYTFDLSEYHGKIVTVTFKAKTVTNSGYKLYFTQHLSGTTSAAYGKEVLNVNTNNWTDFTYTFKVGATTNSSNNTFSHYSDKSFDKNKNDYGGFYITGGDTHLTEFEIRDFEIHVQYDQEEVDISSISLEKGYYNSNGTQNNSNNEYYVRVSEPILLKGGSYYSVEFDNDNYYKYYTYLYKLDGKYEKAYGYQATEGTFYLAEDRYVRFFFRFMDGNAKLEPNDIKNLRIIKHTNNNIVPSTKFTYDLITKVKVNLVDSRDEIADNNYYITIYDSENNELYNQDYVELVDTNKVINQIKQLDLEENKNYIIALRIKIRDRYYTLNTFELSTDDEVLSVASTSDWRYMQPYGNYIFLNDIDFINYTDQRLGWGYRYFHGTIDFQGYKMIVYANKSDGNQNTNYRRIARLEKDAVLKNLVLDFNLDNQGINNSLNGIFGTNYGTIENLIINIKDTHAKDMPQLYTSPLLDTNAITGKVRNFVIKLDGDLHYYSDSAVISRVNNGIIENGYAYGGNIIADYTNNGNPARNIGLLQRQGGVKSQINKVFSLVSIKMPNNQSNDFTGVLSYETYGQIKDTYVVGDANPNLPAYGPVSGHIRATGRFDNVYYISDNIYTSEFQQKTSVVSLTDKVFQNEILGDAFIVDEMLDLGYYPQVKFSSTKMPSQDYIELPKITSDDYADIISTKVIEKTNNTARISVNVNNILGEEIKEIVIADLTTEIESQVFKDGTSTVILKVSNPTVYTHRYQIRSISSVSTSGYTSTRKYDMGEKYLVIDFFKEIYSVDDFILINKGLNQNYAIMNDLDFKDYSNYYINNFSGKIDGNNHVLKNIYLETSGKNGLFNQMNGTLQNIYFENVNINSASSTYYAIVGYSNQSAQYFNVHINNINIIVPEASTKENIYVGSLVGNSYAAKITNCSAVNVRINSNASVFGIVMGGLVGYSNATIMSNSFTKYIDLSITNSSSSNGIGGLIGREVSASGLISESYSTGKIFSNSAYVGGIVGNGLGYIEKVFSTVDISGDMNFMGGIAGLSKSSADGTINTLYLGNIYTASVDTTINRISGNYVVDQTNYAMSSSLINGVSSNQSNGEQLLTYDQLLLEETWLEIFDGLECFDYSKVSESIIPKLYDYDGVELLPNQDDEKLFVNLFNINNMVVDKHAEYANITLYLDNPKEYDITKMDLENATYEITRNVKTNGLTVLEFKLIPTKFLDNYKISNIYYNDNGNEVKIEKNFRVDSTFYKNLASFEDWQNISKTLPENYVLISDIDFKDKQNINLGVVFNRLETASSEVTYSLKNLEIVNTKNKNYVSMINKIVTSLKNVTFDNIKITDETSSSNNYSNVILFNFGHLNNLTFKNITINSKKENYVGVVGRNDGSVIKDITLDNVNVTGNQRVGGFISTTASSINHDFDNINATRVNVNANGAYAGGIIAISEARVDYGFEPVYNNFNISNSNIVSTAHYVGGIVGLGDANNSIVDNVYVKGDYYVGGAIGNNRSRINNVTVKNSKVEGIGYYIGGLAGVGHELYDCYVFNSEIIGLEEDTHSIGGLAGYKTSYTASRLGVIDSKVLNNGSITGGLYGYVTGGNLFTSFVTGSTISGSEYSGGIIGRMTYPDIRYMRTINSTINATSSYSGGLVGHYDNDRSFGNINEGYLREGTVENSTIMANSYAGGFFGKLSAELHYVNRVRRLYSDSDVVVEDGANYGISVGNQFDSDVIYQPAVYFYENLSVNNNDISTMASTTVLGNNILDSYSFNHGFFNSDGSVKPDNTQEKIMYSDLIYLEANKEYQIDIGHGNQSNVFNVYLYNNEKKYISAFNSSSVENYIDKYHDLTYANTVRFRTHTDFYIRIYFADVTLVKSKSLREVIPSSISVSQNSLLSTEQLKERLTWNQYNKNGTAIKYDYSKLNFDRAYWDFETINKNMPGEVSINDLSGKNRTLKAKSEYISSKGINFNGADNYGEVSNFVLPTSGNFTFQTTLTAISRRSYQWVFSSRNLTSKNNGFGVFIHDRNIYVWIYNTWYSTGIYIPHVLKEVNIAITYENNSILNVYLNGVLGYTGKPNKKMAILDGTKTYIAYDDEYSAESYRFMGTVKNMMIYDRTLSSEEINNNIASSSGVTNSANLELYYDFTNTKLDYESYYPIVKHNTDEFEVKNQPLTVIPNEPSKLVYSSSAIYNSLNSLTSSYDIYSSGVDTINLEFDKISKGMSFTYIINGKEYNSDITKKVYTLSYDYNSDAQIILRNSFETKTIKLDKDMLSKKVSIYNGKYYYIKDNILYENDKQLINNALHIKNNLVLLKGNEVYNLNTKSKEKIIVNVGILSIDNPLYKYVLEDKIISTYYNFTNVNDEIKDGQIIINNNHMYVFNTSNVKNEYLVFNTYNNNEYQIVLTKKNKIESYKEKIKYPSSFVNTNIEQIAFDMFSNNTEMIVLYKSGDVLVFNYVTGKKLYESNFDVKASLFEYISSEFSDNSLVLQKSIMSYKNSKDLISDLENVRDSEVKENLNLISSLDNSASNKLTNKYVSVYNSNKNQYEVYNVNDLVEINKVELEQGESLKDKDISISNDKIYTLSMNEKLKSSTFLYNYFNVEKVNTVSNNRIFIYMSIIVLVIVNLFVLSIKFNNKEETK